MEFDKILASNSKKRVQEHSLKRADLQSGTELRLQPPELRVHVYTAINVQIAVFQHFTEVIKLRKIGILSFLMI